MLVLTRCTEFDKRTNLGAATTFPKLILSDAIMSRSMAKAVCQQVSQDLIRIVPQVEDFACPICSDIVWRPIRMDCKHLLCIRCTIVLQRQRKPLCPMCRGDVIMKANTGNPPPSPYFHSRSLPHQPGRKMILSHVLSGLWRRIKGTVSRIQAKVFVIWNHFCVDFGR